MFLQNTPKTCFFGYTQQAFFLVLLLVHKKLYFKKTYYKK
jgi:hypothetical protein